MERFTPNEEDIQAGGSNGKLTLEGSTIPRPGYKPFEALKKVLSGKLASRRTATIATIEGASVFAAVIGGIFGGTTIYKRLTTPSASQERFSLNRSVLNEETKDFVLSPTVWIPNRTPQNLENINTVDKQLHLAGNGSVIYPEVDLAAVALPVELTSQMTYGYKVQFNVTNIESPTQCIAIIAQNEEGPGGLAFVYNPRSGTAAFVNGANLVPGGTANPYLTEPTIVNTQIESNTVEIAIANNGLTGIVYGLVAGQLAASYQQDANTAPKGTIGIFTGDPTNRYVPMVACTAVDLLLS